MARDESTLGGTSFGDFYARHADALVTWFARRVLDAETALDLAAETFAQAYLSRRRFKGTTGPEAVGWLYAIARHQLNRYYRKGSAERRAINRLKAQLPTPLPEEIDRIDELASIGAAREALAGGMQELPEAQQDAIRLRIVEDLAYAEVASRLGVSEQTARARVSRGLRALKGYLGRDASKEEAVA